MAIAADIIMCSCIETNIRHVYNNSGLTIQKYLFYKFEYSITETYWCPIKHFLLLKWHTGMLFRKVDETKTSPLSLYAIRLSVHWLNFQCTPLFHPKSPSMFLYTCTCILSKLKYSHYIQFLFNMMWLIPVQGGSLPLQDSYRKHSRKYCDE